MTASLEQRARHALAHKDIKFIFDDLPAGYRDNPKALRELLIGVVEGHRLASSSAYKEAHAALSELQDARDLQHRIATAYHDPKLRAEFGEARIDAALRDPAAAYAELLDLSAKGKLSAAAVRAFDTLAEAREYSRAAGQEWSAPQQEQIPTDNTKRETEIATLLSKSADGKLSKAEDARLLSLYEARLASEATENPAPASAPKRPDEFRQLAEKSITGKLTTAEDARYTELAQARAVEQGLVDPADMPDNFSEEGSDE
jgi:hypothetical protein